jgi:hypothetical protein
VITLADVLLLVIMFVVFRMFLLPQTSSKRIEGVQFQLETFVFDADTYLNLTVERVRERPVDDDALVSVHFPDGETVTDLVPTAIGESYTFRHVLPAERTNSDGGSVSVSVTALGEEFTLRHDPD